MTDEQRDDFDDPILKAALKRACGDERAPADLRRRIAAALANDSASAPRQPAIGPRPIRPWRRPVYYAAAALLLIALGVSLYQLTRKEGGEGPIPVNRVVADEVLVAMVRTHDRCVAEGDSHHLAGLPRDDFEAIGRSLAERVRHDVLSVNLADEGWRFRGAAVCPVGERRAAHLVYARGSQTLSIFSVLVEPRPDQTDSTCKTSVAAHPLAAMRIGKTVHALVCHGPANLMSPEECERLLNGHQDRIASPGLSRADAELLYAVQTGSARRGE